MGILNMKKRRPQETILKKKLKVFEEFDNSVKLILQNDNPTAAVIMDLDKHLNDKINDEKQKLNVAGGKEVGIFKIVPNDEKTFVCTSLIRLM